MAGSSHNSKQKNFLIFGQNVRLQRAVMNLSFSDLAQLAEIGRSTLARVQNGEKCSKRTQQNIADALGIRVEALWDPITTTPQEVCHFPAERERWAFANSDEALTWPINKSRKTDPDEIQTKEERWRVGRNGYSSAFVNVRRSHLTVGYNGAALIEVFQSYLVGPGRMTPAILCHCIRGNLHISVGNNKYTLQEGETLTADAHVPFVLEPTEALNSSFVPPLVIGVQLVLRPTGVR